MDFVYSGIKLTYYIFFKINVTKFHEFRELLLLQQSVIGFRRFNAFLVSPKKLFKGNNYIYINHFSPSPTFSLNILISSTACGVYFYSTSTVPLPDLSFPNLFLG